MPKKEVLETMSKKDRLTLSQLAGYDDILTDALVDHVYFWTVIRKNRSKYNSARGISEDDITTILLHDVVVSRDSQKAETALLKLPGLRKFYDNLKTDREKEDFRRHMRKYINIWLPDCPFEVTTTNRYTILTHEAAATARRLIKKGDAVKYLCGNLVSMTPEEEQDLDLTRRDFSIVMSSRKKTPSLFLGPARFANHDCNANARLVTRGSEGMQVVAVRDIQVDEEITVTYGDNYFGEGNCECLCSTCEREGRNGWPAHDKSMQSSGTSTPLGEQENQTPGPYSFRRTRRNGQLPVFSPASMTPESDGESPRKRRKLGTGRASSSLGTEISNSRSPVRAVVEKSRSTLRNVVSANSDSAPGLEVGAAKKEDQDEDELLAGVRAAFSTAKDLVSQIKQARDQYQRNFLNSVEGQLPRWPEVTARRGSTSIYTEKPPQITDMKIESPIMPRRSGRRSPLKTGMRQLPTPVSSSEACSIFDDVSKQTTSPSSTPATSLEPPSDSDLSSLSSTADLDDTTLSIIPKPLQKGKRYPQKPQLIPTVENSTPTDRYSGDYIRTPLLLGETYSRWVDCGTCPACWVQQNGYLTRKECPRCERHSKLYGYQWPKTEKTGKGDEEERVMDHRTVHRFLKRDEEVKQKKRGRGVLKVQEEVAERTESQIVVEEVESEKPTPRRRGRPRKG